MKHWSEHDSHGANCAIRFHSAAPCTCGKADYLAAECTRSGCGHTHADHERGTGPCNVKHADGTHCVCYQFQGGAR